MRPGKGAALSSMHGKLVLLDASHIFIYILEDTHPVYSTTCTYIHDIMICCIYSV